MSGRGREEWKEGSGSWGKSLKERARLVVRERERKKMQESALTGRDGRVGVQSRVEGSGRERGRGWRILVREPSERGKISFGLEKKRNGTRGHVTHQTPPMLFSASYRSISHPLRADSGKSRSACSNERE